MVKHTQAIRRQIADELFECVGPFCWAGALRVKWVKLIFCPIFGMSSVHIRMNASAKDTFKVFFLAFVNPLSGDPTNWTNTLKQFIGCY